VAARACVAPGYDLTYHLRQVANDAGRAAAGYYTRAYEHGEPPVRWLGKGAQALGLEQDTMVNGEVFLKLFGERIDQRLLAAEPHATAERKMQLARGARLDELDRMIYDAVYAGFEHFEEHAGYVRAGNHRGRVDGKETGRWEKGELAAAAWLQHLSRDGDMQLHVHTTILHTARTVADGKWRAPDNHHCYGQYAGSFASYVAAHFESAATRRFGLRWERRPDGFGFEIKGIDPAVLAEFSSRRKAVDAKVRERARRYEDTHGRKPNQRVLNQMLQDAILATRKGKEEDFDLVETHTGWAAQLRGNLGVDLASIAPAVAGHADAVGTRGPSPAAIAAGAREALQRLEADKTTWTRPDVVKYLAWTLPAQVRHLEPGAALRLLEHTADRVVAGEFGEVSLLEAPRWLEYPRELLRADGRCVYEPPGDARYATQTQLDGEAQLTADAQADGAPALGRDVAARLLGADADADTLDADLADAHTRGTQAGATSSGLNVGQRAALFQVLTSGRQAEVIDAPAGCGKTTTLMHAARAWQAAGQGRVFGVTPSQASRDTLAAGIPASFNSAQWLGHSQAQRGRYGPRVQLRPGDLVVVDEGSQVSTADLGDTIGQARMAGAKVVIAADTQQLQAVENGGGVQAIRDSQGCVQLPEPVRFTAQWERDASLLLRRGDPAALAAYDEHGRIHGGEPEEMMEAAAKAYVASFICGRNVLLMARERERAAELARRVTGDLRHLGYVGDTVRFGVVRDGGDGAVAEVNPGDLIIARKNDHQLETDPGHTLANGDTLLVEDITPGGLVVRRQTGVNTTTGERQFAGQAFTYTDLQNCGLAYGITTATAQSRTVQDGYMLLSGAESRQDAYVGMSRGTDRNEVFVFTLPAKAADLERGSRAAPELARADRLERERAGLPAEPADTAETGQRSRDAVAVLADVLGRDGAEDSATQYARQALASQDHLAALNAMWEGEAGKAIDERYRQIVIGALPGGYRQDLSSEARWLFRTLRAAENAGLDPRQVVEDAVTERDLSGSRDVASVINARVRARVGTPMPQRAKPWSERVPQMHSEEMQRFVADVAQAMDARKARLGEYAAEAELPWAIQVLGPVPEDPLDRLAWQQRASDIAAYRELYGITSDTDTFGAEPLAAEPDKRQAYWTAFSALPRTDGVDLRSLDDRGLWLRRSTYQAETSWAPRYVANELRQVRLGATDASRNAVRQEAEVQAAKDDQTAGRHRGQAASYRVMERFYRDQEETLAATMEDRAEWYKVTEHGRRLAVAADAELRRRHPQAQIAALRSAEPEAVSEEEHGQLVLTGGEQAPETPQWVAELKDRRPFRERLEEHHGVMVPDEDPDYGDLGEAWPVWQQQKDAIVQPPKPELRPSPRVLQRAGERAAERDGYKYEEYEAG